MSRLETIDRSNWEAFTKAPLAVLVLARSDCPYCKKWSEQLTKSLADADWWPDVRFGKLLLEQRGLVGFKRANPWLAQVEVLPYNIIYHNGEQSKRFAGGDLQRLENHLERLTG